MSTSFFAARIGVLLTALLLLGCPAPSSFAAPATPPAAQPLDATLIRSKDLADLPQIQVRNLLGETTQVQVTARMESPAGEISHTAVASYRLNPHQTLIVPAYARGPKRLKNEIALVRISVQAAGESNATDFAAIRGTPQPVNPNTANLFCMNVHLERYSDDDVWKMLRMLKNAGITSTRLDVNFNAPDSSGSYSPADAGPVDREVLASEAFGIASFADIVYFPGPFYTSPEKMRMAHDWAAALAEHYKGRITAWQYGNETNAGWAAYGAAADLEADNAAFARGTLSVDPNAKTATVGVAEGETGYVQALLKDHVSDYTNVLCIHPYGGTAEASIGQYLRVRRIADDYPGIKEIWLDEVGFAYAPGGRINKTTGQLTSDNGYTLDQQADQLVRLYTLGKAFSVNRMYWYDFFGKNDPEGYWIVGEDFTPRPAYTALAALSKTLQDTEPIGGTDIDELVQRHYFRHKDGSVSLIAWALRDDVPADLHLPRPLAARDFLGNVVNGATDGHLTLGNRPIVIDGLTTQDIPRFLNKEILVSTLDDRNFYSAMSRWLVAPGESFQVPCVAYNTSEKAVHVQPMVLRTNPDWTITTPAGFDLAPGQTVTEYFTLTAPANAVRGVEYHFDFAADVDGLRRAVPYSIRVKTKGDFPYDDILADRGHPSYPMWDPFNEPAAGTGQPALTASYGSVTIDGDLTDWSPSEFHPIDQELRSILRDPWQPDRKDWTGRVALRWDDKNLYAAFLVLDDELSLLDFTSRDWRDNDHVRLFLSTEGDPAKHIDLTSQNEYDLFFAPTGIAHTEPPVVFCASLGGYVHEDIEPQVKLASRVWAGGYLIEAAIPFSAMNYTPKPGAVLGLNVLAADADSGHRQIEAMTYFKDASYWNSPKSLGTLTLLPVK